MVDVGRLERRRAARTTHRRPDRATTGIRAGDTRGRAGKAAGGDLDCNPFVIAELTRTALPIQANAIFCEHIRLIY